MTGDYSNEINESTDSKYDEESTKKNTDVKIDVKEESKRNYEEYLSDITPSINDHYTCYNFFTCLSYICPCFNSLWETCFYNINEHYE